MKKLYREVVIMPEKEHKVLLKLAKITKFPKSKIFRQALVELAPFIFKAFKKKP